MKLSGRYKKCLLEIFHGQIKGSRNNFAIPFKAPPDYDFPSVHHISSLPEGYVMFADSRLDLPRPLYHGLPYYMGTNIPEFFLILGPIGFKFWLFSLIPRSWRLGSLWTPRSPGPLDEPLEPLDNLESLN